MLDAYRLLPGNAGSPHVHGHNAKDAVHGARDRIGRVVGAKRNEVFFTSGATESNNLAILGLAQYGRESGKRHIVSSAIEHKAVLEPLERMRSWGFEVTLVKPHGDGRIRSEDLIDSIRTDTLLVSLMHANNETGVIQPISQVARAAEDRGVWLHVDAAQGFGRDLEPLAHLGIASISISGHKIFGPQGIGALILRRQRKDGPVLEPVFVGGGQELGLRSGTLAVPLIVGFGLAAELALQEHALRKEACERIGRIVTDWAGSHGGQIHGSAQYRMPHVLNVSFPGWDADDLLEAVRESISISDGAACTSVCATASHVLSAMGLGEPQLSGAVRLSWSHQTDQGALVEALASAGRVIAARRLV
jgi:cysteine desulfurase